MSGSYKKDQVAKCNGRYISAVEFKLNYSKLEEWRRSPLRIIMMGTNKNEKRMYRIYVSQTLRGIMHLLKILQPVAKCFGIFVTTITIVGQNNIHSICGDLHPI